MERTPGKYTQDVEIFLTTREKAWSAFLTQQKDNISQLERALAAARDKFDDAVVVLMREDEYDDATYTEHMGSLEQIYNGQKTECREEFLQAEEMNVNAYREACKRAREKLDAADG